MSRRRKPKRDGTEEASRHQVLNGLDSMIRNLSHMDRSMFSNPGYLLKIIRETFQKFLNSTDSESVWEDIQYELLKSPLNNPKAGGP